jgi:regulator of sigma E protease
MFLIDLILFIIVLGIIILIHELGHFYFAKKAGILCHEFAIGMGPAIYQKRKGETIYSIRSIPIGGYVSMAGESISDALIKKGQVIGFKLNDQSVISDIILNDALPFDHKGIVVSYDLYGKAYDPLFIEIEVDGTITKYSVLRDARYQLSEQKTMWITPAEKSFESKTLWQRFLVIFAGPFMNFVLALGLFIIISFFVLKPNLDSNEINEVSAIGPGASVGLAKGDRIIQINDTLIGSWSDLSVTMGMLSSPKITLLYTREGVRLKLN